MIEPPQIAQRAAGHAAAIALDIPRGEMHRHFGPAVAEIMAELARQVITPAGPVVAHYLRMPPGQFDFEVGVPVAQPVTAAGRVAPRDMPSRTVARTVYHGDYPGLLGAWGEFMGWIAANGHTPAADLLETYLTDPSAVPDPAEYRTLLERPLA